MYRGLLREAEAKALRTLTKVQAGYNPEQYNEDGDGREPKKAATS